VSRLVPLPPPQVLSGSEFGRFGCVAYIVMYATGLREDHISGDIAFAIWQVAY
jgi:trehalose/maltose hydrolase-like predicted phosphorylase